MLIISDTTPIISFIKLDMLGLLEKMFGKIYIPQAVFDELTTNPGYQEEAELIRNSTFIRLEKVQREQEVDRLMHKEGLDIGECEALVLAVEQKADLLLMDEHKGRLVAEKMGVTITGTVGILLQAYDDGTLDADRIWDYIRKLRENGIRIGPMFDALVEEHVGKADDRGK